MHEPEVSERLAVQDVHATFLFHSWPEIVSNLIWGTYGRNKMQNAERLYPGRVDGLKSAATSRSLGNRGHQTRVETLIGPQVEFKITN